MLTLRPAFRSTSFRISRVAALVLGLAGFGTGCGSDDITGITPNAKTAILSDIVADVIQPTLAGFETTSAALASATVALAQGPDDVTLGAARSAWRAARAPWESTEGFGFGPAATGGFDGNSDSWPVNLVDLNAVLAGSAALDQAAIDGLGEDVKGFHAIEYVLFGLDGSKVVADFTARELAYLAASTQNLATQAVGLADAWNLTDGYGNALATAGTGSAVYASQNDALQELVQAMADVADEVANGKLAGPLGPPVDVELLESRFSNNTGTDLQNNLLGVTKLYAGQGGGHGLQALVAAVDPSLAQEVTAELQAAAGSLAAISADLESSLGSNAAAVQAAISAFTALQTTLVTKVLPAVQQ